MAESLVSVIENITEITSKGDIEIQGISGISIDDKGNLFYNNNMDVLLSKIRQKEEIEAFPSFVGKYVKPMHLEILFGMRVLSANKEERKALTFLPKDFIKNINRNVFSEISDMCWQLVTPEECNILPKEIFIDLINNGKLRYLSDESLEFMTKRLDFKKIFKEKEKLSNILKSLYEANKLEHLSKEAVQAIKPDFIGGLPSDYLLPIAKHLTADQTKFVNDKQFNTIKDKINPESIRGLNSDVISGNDEFLENLTIEQADGLTKDQLKVIKEKNKFDSLPVNVLSIVAGKIEGQLFEFDEKTLNGIIHNKGEDIFIENSESRLSDFNANIEFRGKITKKEDFDIAISKYLENENWSTLRDYCFFQVESVEQRTNIYEVLNEKIKSKAENIYALVDKIQLLLSAILLAPDEEELNNNYKQFEEAMDLFIKKTPKTIDEYFTKFDLYSLLLADSSLDTEFRKMISEKQEELITKDFVNKYFKNPERKLDNFTREKIVEMYLGRIAFLAEKEDVKLAKFKTELSYSELLNLTGDETKLADCLLKIKEYEPNLENSIRQVVGDGIKVVMRVAGAYFAAKTAAKSNSTAVKVVGGTAAACSGYEAYKIADSAIQIKDYSDPNFRKIVHRKEKEEKINKKETDISLKSTASSLSKWFFGSFLKKENDEKLPEDQIKKAKTIHDNLVNKGLEKELENLKKEEKEFKYKKMSESWEKNNKNKSALEQKRQQLINYDNRIRKQAAELIKKQQIDKLFENHPDFKTAGFISRIRENISQISNGFAEGVLDAINKYKGDAFKESIREEKSEEEIVIAETRYRLFMDELLKINKEYEKRLTKIEHRKYYKQASINKDDKEKFEEFKKNARDNKERIKDEKIKLFKLEESKKVDFGITITNEDVLGHSNDNVYPNQTNKDAFEQATERTTTELNIEENNNRNYHREQLGQQPEREGCDILLK